MPDAKIMIVENAESDITVFISGKSGTSKELVANSLHANSPRKDEEFVALDCAGGSPTNIMWKS